MAKPLGVTWKTIDVCREELALENVLPSGQAFRWRQCDGVREEWTGVIGNK